MRQYKLKNGDRFYLCPHYKPYFRPYKVEEDEDFDPLSAFQYFNPKVRQKMFYQHKARILNEVYFGVGVHTKSNPRQIYWRDSSIVEVSDDIFKNTVYDNEESFEQALKAKSSFTLVKETEVGDLTEKRFKALEYAPDDDKSIPLQIVPTEGLFRYKAAYEFAKALEGQFKTHKFENFHYYNDENFQLELQYSFIVNSLV